MRTRHEAQGSERPRGTCAGRRRPWAARPGARGAAWRPSLLSKAAPKGPGPARSVQPTSVVTGTARRPRGSGVRGDTTPHARHYCGAAPLPRARRSRRAVSTCLPQPDTPRLSFHDALGITATRSGFHFFSLRTVGDLPCILRSEPISRRITKLKRPASCPRPRTEEGARELPLPACPGIPCDVLPARRGFGRTTSPDVPRARAVTHFRRGGDSAPPVARRREEGDRSARGK